MPSANDLTPDNRFIAMFVGPSGSGKTVAAASFPKPIDIMDFDGRIRGLLGASWIDRKDIHYEYYPPKGDDTLTKVNQKLDSMLGLFRIGQLPQKTEILDSLTSETFAMICQSMQFSHVSARAATKDQGKKGKFIGPLAMAGPEDYGFESQATYDMLAYFKSVPIPNVIVSAHIVDVYGREDESNEFSNKVVIGKKLSLRDKLAANIPGSFDHIFEFDRTELNGKIKFWVKFWSSIARTSYKLPEGQFDITGINFYDFLMNKIKENNK